MRGPELTTSELLEHLDRQIVQSQQLGLTRRQAIHAVAVDTGADETKLTALLSAVPVPAALVAV